MGSFTDLLVYQKAFSLAMEIFQVTKRFPKEEIYSMTDQIRRSSRSVCSNLAEAYRKRSYRAYFLSKLSDADMENTETAIWLQFAKSCQYITAEDYERINGMIEETGKLIGFMIQ